MTKGKWGKKSYGGPVSEGELAGGPSEEKGEESREIEEGVPLAAKMPKGAG